MSILPFGTDTLARLREVQEDHMQDTCRVLAYSSSVDEYGVPTPSYSAGPAVICGLRLYSPREIQARGEVPVISGVLRMPVDTAIDTRDHIRVTHRFGEELGAPMLFEIEGPVERGPSGLQVYLRVVDEEDAGV